MPRALQFSHISPARQTLLRLCQSTNYGHIQDLQVRDRQPVLPDPHCIVCVDIKLDSVETPRPEVASADFVLCAEVGRLMALLDRIQDGKIARLEVRAGIPRRIIFERRTQEVAGVSG
jgi:hypothetical protein